MASLRASRLRAVGVLRLFARLPLLVLSRLLRLSLLLLSLLRLRAVLALRRGVGLLPRVLLLALEAGLRGVGLLARVLLSRLRGVGLLARLAELVQHGGGRVQRSDLAFLQLEEQDHASRTQSNREQREQVEADREVNQIVIVGEDVERLDKRDDSQSERTTEMNAHFWLVSQ